MDSLYAGVKDFAERHNFYPGVFYNENDINDPLYGIRASILNLDEYDGVFIHQDSPDTPIDGFKGVEFRTSVTKSTKSPNQLLWTIHDITVPELGPVEYDPEPSVQFCGTAVFLPDGRPFPQQTWRIRALAELGISGLPVQINLKQQVFANGGFTHVAGKHLEEESYWGLMQKHPYGLSVRGWGNWDLRFYELLASGRIPVHISSDDELPFEKVIPWREYIVIVDDMRRIAEAVTEFHSQFTDTRSLTTHMARLRALYYDRLRFPAFCRRFEQYYKDDVARILR